MSRHRVATILLTRSQTSPRSRGETPTACKAAARVRRAPRHLRSAAWLARLGTAPVLGGGRIFASLPHRIRGRQRGRAGALPWSRRLASDHANRPRHRAYRCFLLRVAHKSARGALSFAAAPQPAMRRAAAARRDSKSGCVYSPLDRALQAVRLGWRLARRPRPPSARHSARGARRQGLAARAATSDGAFRAGAP